MQPVLSIYIYFYEYLNTALTVHCKQQYMFNYFINFIDFLFNLAQGQTFANPEKLLFYALCYFLLSKSVHIESRYNALMTSKLAMPLIFSNNCSRFFAFNKPMNLLFSYKNIFTLISCFAIFLC